MSIPRLLSPFVAVSVVGVMTCAAMAAEGEAPMAPANPTPAAGSPAIGDHMDVAIDYTLTVDGKVVDSSEGKAPLHYVQGGGQIIPGLEKALVGLHAGDSKEVTVSPDQGYGAVDPTATVEVAKTQLPANAKPEIGMMLRGQTPEGHGFAATIKEIKADSVVLDLNHPLAGKTLHFKVKVTDVKPAAAKPAAPS